ncbi:MAG TPA: TonB-dependent receptor [Terracidiphilus sp.]|nr:TonB-dependent receptor [Terracidiphilus sp.]
MLKNGVLTTVLLLFLVFSARIWAQDVASITGTVTDQSGAVVPGVSVTLENPSTSVSYKALTNSLGSYTIQNVQPGPGYKITFSASGFSPTVITGLYLNVSATRTQNARLQVGNTAQTVEVSAAASTVTLDTTDATVGNNFQVQFMNDLPVQDRSNPTALFYQQPGVNLDGAVTGARTDQSNVTLDGLEVNDNATGEFGNVVANAPVDSVQEFRGVTAGPLSSAGEGGGGQYQLVTKSGTNEFHGALVEYHRDTDLEANDWFNNNNGVPRPPLIRNQFGGNVGGPIWRQKAFFFFDWDSRRDTLSNIEDRTVPLGTNTTGYRGGEVAYINSSNNIETLTESQVAALDPKKIGWNQAEMTLFQSRYPMANDTSGAVGDLVNTGGFRFNAPFPYVFNDYVSRIDFNLTDKMKVFGRGTVARQSSTQAAIQFPGDPPTYPFFDRSYAYVVGHTWTINDRMLNQAEYGETYEDYSFNAVYNPQGVNQFSYSGLSGPYAAGNNSQDRTYPIPVLLDDFTWQKGRHSLSFGGTFKWETPNEFAAENFYFPNVGITGNTYLTALSPNLRPADISGAQSATSIFDSAFSTALGVVADVGANFDYNNKGVVGAQGSGLDLNYRYYETEVYFGDTWKVTPNLDISYGVRYQNYTVPYETRGEQAITNLTQDGKTSNFSWDTYWKDREAQSAAGNTADDGLPFLQFIYGGKANHEPSYFHPNNKDFAPRLAFAYSPSFDKKSVFRGGIGVVYDHSLINALQFQQLQTSYVFEASSTNFFGTPGDPTATLESAPRFAGISSPPPPPTAPTIVTPYVPFVQSGFPYGLPDAEFNLMMDTNLKTPYNIQLDFGFQHEFPQGYILKADYVGRLGRRLLAVADGSQLLDFPDASGASSQTMSGAMGGITTQLRQNAGLGPLGAIEALTPEPWFEDMLPGLNAYLSSLYGIGFSSNTQAIGYAFYPLPQRGDFADLMQGLSTTGYLPTNTGMASQFSSNSVWTNKGSSTYHGLLVTLHKNAGYGLQFDLNYTWSHSIDNTSAIANFIPASSGFGFICDVQRPRECRGNSTFDVTNVFNGNFIYELPFGRGRSVAANAPYWMNEIIGGWEISGLPTINSGTAYNAYANAYITSFASDAPATLIGSPALLKAKVNGGKGSTLFAFSNPTAALGAFTGPTGFDIGQRDNLRGPGFFDLDLGLGKTFPVWEDKVNLKFRCDAFNATNHPNFSTPSANDITQANGVPFGTITGTVTPPGSDHASRVLQLSLRLEF